MTAHPISVWTALLFALGVPVAVVRAQVLDVERSRAFVVGSSPFGFAQDRADASRSGRSRTLLPVGTLRTVWSTALGATIDKASVVDEHGSVYVVDASMNATSITSDGAVAWTLALPAAAGACPSPPTLLADGTLVVLDSSGNALAIRKGSVRWRAPGGLEGRTATSLALEDGGVAICAGPAIELFDADGGLRARTKIPSAIKAPLVASRGSLFAADATGTVWSWRPGPAEPQRVGSFGEATLAFAAVGRWLLTIPVSGSRIVALDVTNGQLSALAAAAPGERFFDPPTLDFVSPDHSVSAFVRAVTASSDIFLAVGLDGRERSRTILAGRAPVLSLDAGVALIPNEMHTPPLIDEHGTLTFATSSGDVGVVRGDTVWRASGVCGPLPRGGERVMGSGSRTTPLVVGLAPLRPGILVATCASGVVEALAGSAAEGIRGGKGDGANL